MCVCSVLGGFSKKLGADQKRCHDWANRIRTHRVGFISIIQHMKIRISFHFSEFIRMHVFIPFRHRSRASGFEEANPPDALYVFVELSLIGLIIIR